MEMEEKKDPRKEFSEFLKRAYAAYIVRETRNGGNVPSQTDFAQWLGVTQTSFSNWINATRPPDIDNLDAVATKLGNEVYAIFGKPPRMPKEPAANVVFTNWYKLTKPQQQSGRRNGYEYGGTEFRRGGGQLPKRGNDHQYGWGIDMMESRACKCAGLQNFRSYQNCYILMQGRGL